MASEVVPPSGTVTFLFTDVAGSTRLWAREPDAMEPALEIHDVIVRSAIEAAGGYIFTTAGDSFAAAFSSADAAVEAAATLQGGLWEAVWPTSRPIAVRVGLHAGVAVERDGDYFGPVLNTAARVEAAANAGQVVATAVVNELATATLHPLGNYELRDLPDALELFQVGEGEFGPLRSLDRVVSTLPVMGSRLVGRETEVGEVRTALESSRLITVVGVGGCGKTRLAVEVGGRELPERRHVFFVDLTKAVDETDVLGQVIAGVGLVLNAGVDRQEALIKYLSGRESLVVLDNCEHLLDPVAELVEVLLNGCAELGVLATSREPLGLDGERVWRIPSLSGGSAGAGVRLFVERAAERNGSFGTGAARADVIVEVCERLDGIPLAIELAAARTTSMSVEEIRDRLDDRFRLLTGGRRRARQRQQTLESVVTWSHDLLNHDEQVMLRRLAVFDGGFAGTDVGPVTGFDDYEALDLVESLVDKSLVDASRLAAGVPRLRLLETVRLYAQQRLEDAQEQTAVRDAHMQHFIGAGAGHTLVGNIVDRGLLLRQLTEVDNVCAAIEWARERDEDLLAAVAVAANSASMNATGATSRYVELLRGTYSGASDSERATLLAMRGNLALIGLLDEAEFQEDSRQAIELFDTGNRDDDLFWTLSGLGVTGRGTIAQLQRYRSAAHECGAHSAMQAACELGLGSLLAMAGELDDAIAAFQTGFSLGHDVVIGSVAAYLLTSLLTLQGNNERAQAVAASMESVPGSFADAPHLAAAVAAMATTPKNPNRLLAEAAQQLVSGRILAQEGDYLVWFAWGRHLGGDDERAAELLDNSTNRFSRVVAVLIAQRVHGWTDEQTRKRMASAGIARQDPENARRLFAQTSQLLDEEIRDAQS